MCERFCAAFVLTLGLLVPAHQAVAQGGDDQAREEQWRKLFMEGIAAYEKRDEEGAIEKWKAANEVYGLRPEAYNNIAVVLADRGDHAGAAMMYREALAVLPRMRAPLESERLERLGARRDVYQGLLASADELFRQGKDMEAVEALQALTAADPNNTSAWYTLGLALNRLRRWADLIPVARRSVELTPLNASARALLVTASKAQGVAPDPMKAAPVYLEDVQMVRSGQGLVWRGTMVGAAAPAGTSVRLEVTAEDAGEAAGTYPVTLTAPAKGQRAPFSFKLPAPAFATSYHYRVLE